jgi:hypothetical protein
MVNYKCGMSEESKKSPMKSCFVLFILLLMIGCDPSSETESIILKMPEINKLNGITVKLPVNMLNPKAMCVTDDKLIIFDEVKSDLFKVFKLPDLYYLYSWGNVGRGPNEFLTIDENYFRAFSNQLELMDYGILKRLRIYDDRMEKIDAISLPRLRNPLNRLQKLSDTLYMADNIIDGNQEHILINIVKNEIIKEFGKYPDDNLNIKSNLGRYQIYSKFVISNPKGNKFAVFYESFPRVRIYNSIGELQKSVVIKEDMIRKYSVDNRDQNVIYFSFPYAENFIYVIRVNKTNNQIEESLDNYKPEIMIWDWNGNLITRYKLDKIISRFAVSEKHKRLYGTFVMNENEIYVFDLPFLY